MEISRLFFTLSRVQTFQVEVDCANAKTAKGSGSVDIEHPDKHVIIWRENGRWNQHFNFLEFTNSYKWSRLESGHLGLEHLRYGDERPVELVKLASDKNEIWRSIDPHLCGKDSYLLTLSTHFSALQLVWQINGPDKDQISRVRYI